MEKKEIVIKPGQRVVDWDFISSSKYEDTWTEKSINFKQSRHLQQRRQLDAIQG